MIAPPAPRLRTPGRARSLRARGRGWHTQRGSSRTQGRGREMRGRGLKTEEGLETLGAELANKWVLLENLGAEQSPSSLLDRACKHRGGARKGRDSLQAQGRSSRGWGSIVWTLSETSGKRVCVCCGGHLRYQDNPLRLGLKDLRLYECRKTLVMG